jgi:hypothetical protein
VTTWEFGTTGASIEGLPMAMVDARGMRTEYTYTSAGLPATRRKREGGGKGGILLYYEK